ncbi:MAG: hypothetical protein DRP62_01950 [Planctomycetota bacterium]|nr:MAG: hypothetical protein DRP62_01950 [Planctomycetota bacterium]
MFRSQPLKIALGDLRHETVGRHSVLMPLGVAYIASYLLAHIDENVIEVRIYDRPNVILEDIGRWRPDVVGLSNYCWNSELSRIVFDYSKQLNPETVCVAGGPEFPIEQAECRQYLLQRKEIDFYVYHEGEVAFAELIRKLAEGIVAFELKSDPQGGIMSIHPKTSDLVVGSPIPRLRNLDEIPSPYLNGLLEKWFNGYYAPSIETARGCPFSCGYCHAGQAWYNTITRFSTERIKAELTYIASRMTAYPNVLLSICDANFGMYERDEEIAEQIRCLQDEFGWPNSFDVTTSKANHDRILRIASRLRNKMQVSCSLQSINYKTLKVIKRKNIAMDAYKELQREIRRRDMPSVAELIVPMPEETKASFFEGVKAVTMAGVERIVPYTTMLLKGTYLNSQQCRKKYQMQTKFRLIPRQFGEYAGQKCFEVEEVCVATNTMSFEDYLECRGFAFVSALLSSEQFDLVARHLKELEINNYDYLYYVWEMVVSGGTEVSKIYNEYIKETENELWDSREALYEYFTEPQVYEKLLSGELGDNLIRKYKAKALLECCIPTIELAYLAIGKMAGKKITHEIQKSLDAAKCWMIAVRNISALRDQSSINNSKILHLPYDVKEWYIAGDNSNSLVSYDKPVDYRIFYDTKELDMFLSEGGRLFGKDLSYQIGKLLINWSVNKLWRKCEPVTKESSVC